MTASITEKEKKEKWFTRFILHLLKERSSRANRGRKKHQKNQERVTHQTKNRRRRCVFILSGIGKINRTAQKWKMFILARKSRSLNQSAPKSIKIRPWKEPKLWCRWSKDPKKNSRCIQSIYTPSQQNKNTSEANQRAKSKASSRWKWIKSRVARRVTKDEWKIDSLYIL